MLGIDLVFLPEFASLQENIQLPEFAHGTLMSLETKAGIWAIREAAVKAGVLATIQDNSYIIIKDENGKPFFATPDLKVIDSIEVSISHAGDYAFAVVQAKKVGSTSKKT